MTPVNFPNLVNHVETMIQSAVKGPLSTCPVDKIRLYFELSLAFDGSVGYAQVFLRVEKQKLQIGEFHKSEVGYSLDGVRYDLYKWIDVVMEIARRLIHHEIRADYVKLGQLMDSRMLTRLIDLVNECLDEAEGERNRHIEDIEEVDDTGDTIYRGQDGIEMTPEQWRQSIKEDPFYVGSMSALNDIMNRCEGAISLIRKITFIEDCLRVIEDLHVYFLDREKVASEQSQDDMRKPSWFEHQCYQDAVRRSRSWSFELDRIREEYWLPSRYKGE